MTSSARYRYLLYRRRRRNGHGFPRWLMALALLGALIGIGAGVMAGIGFGVYQSYANDLVPPDEMIAQQPRGGARILDRNGSLLYEFLDDASGLRDPVQSDEISLWMPFATIATEDASFMDNPGVNYKGLTRAAVENFWPFGGTPGFLEGSGGSSITQQLVKNVYFTQDERQERSVDRKLKETVYALELTKKYTKAQIMEWYLNQISYGNVFVGVGAASKGYFSKEPKDLTLWEAATLAGIPASPTYYDPFANPDAALARRNYVLRRMHEEHYIDDAQLYEAVAMPLTVQPGGFPVTAPHFVFSQVQPAIVRLFGEDGLKRDGLIVHTSLDLDLQRRAEGILEEQISTYEYSGGHNGAVVAVDPNTAEVLVYIGSRDYFREDILGQNDMADALNSPGSAFKPFTYVTAFMNLGWGPGTEILDTPLNMDFWDGPEAPRNPGTGFQGPITVRKSLGNSLNIPAIKTALYAGVPEVVTQAKKMGITTLDRQLGPSLTVGGVDVKLIDMVYGYTVFPNNGMLKGVPAIEGRPPGNRSLDPVVITRVEDRDGNVLYPIEENGQPGDRVTAKEERVTPAEQSFMIADILSDGNAQCITFGVCGALSIPGRPLAVKTGTSEPYESSRAIGDTWALAFTPDLVVGSWFGNADNAPMYDISSTSVSWRTVREFQIAFNEGKPVKQFQRPEGVDKRKVCTPSGMKPDKDCGRESPEDWVDKDVATQDDTAWTLARIDVRTGKLATDRTPPHFVREDRYLNTPAGLSAYALDQWNEWRRVLKLGEGGPPTDESRDEDILASITSPAPGVPVSGEVEISGRALSPGFESWRLEYGEGDNPDDWHLINESTVPVADGLLGTLDVTDLPTGVYTLRLVLQDSNLGEVTMKIPILVVPPGTTPEPTPEATPAGADGPGRRNRR